MNAQLLFDSLIKTPFYNFLNTQIQYSHAKAVDNRATMFEEFKQCIRGLGLDCDPSLVLKHRYIADTSKWLKGQYSPSYIKTVDVHPNESKWHLEALAFTQILIRAGFISYVNARKACGSLLKFGDYQTYFGRNGVPQRLTQNTSIYVDNRLDTDSDRIKNTVASGLEQMLNYGRVLISKRDRVNIPFQLCRTDASFFNKNYQGPAAVRFHVQAGVIERNLFEVVIRLRHVGNEDSSNTVHRLIADQLSNVLSHMPHVRNVGKNVGNMIGVSKEDNNKTGVEVRFVINTAYDFTVTSPADLAAPPKEQPSVIKVVKEIIKAEVTEKDVAHFFDRRIMVLNDELGALISNRDTILEQIKQAEFKLAKLIAAKEVL